MTLLPSLRPLRPRCEIFRQSLGACVISAFVLPRPHVSLEHHRPDDPQRSLLGVYAQRGSVDNVQPLRAPYIFGIAFFLESILSLLVLRHANIQLGEQPVCFPALHKLFTINHSRSGVRCCCSICSKSRSISLLSEMLPRKTGASLSFSLRDLPLGLGYLNGLLSLKIRQTVL